MNVGCGFLGVGSGDQIATLLVRLAHGAQHHIERSNSFSQRFGSYFLGTRLPRNRLGALAALLSSRSLSFATACHLISG